MGPEKWLQESEAEQFTGDIYKDIHSLWEGGMGRAGVDSLICCYIQGGAFGEAILGYFE